MVRLITLTRAWRWLQLEGRFRAEVSEKAVTNGTFHVVWTRARVRLWPPRPKTSIAACSVICPRTSAIARSIAVPARDKLIFACAATAFTIALHADRRAATRFRTSGNHKFASTGISLNGVRVALTSRRLSWGRPARTLKALNHRGRDALATAGLWPPLHRPARQPRPLCTLQTLFSFCRRSHPQLRWLRRRPGFAA